MSFLTALSTSISKKDQARARRMRRKFAHESNYFHASKATKHTPTDGWFGDAASSLWGGIKGIGSSGLEGAKTGVQVGTQNYVSQTIGPDGKLTSTPKEAAMPSWLGPAAVIGGGLMILFLMKKA